MYSLMKRTPLKKMDAYAKETEGTRKSLLGQKTMSF